jgi:membrane fusion protein (multidrug efflux system)
MKKSQGAMGAAALALCASMGCARAKAPATPPPATVLVTPAQVRDVPLYVEAVGTLDGYLNVDIRARVRGFLARQHYQDGATVKEGQVLFSIERAEYEDALESARASLARGTAALEHARAQFERKKLLEPGGYVSRQELDDAVAQLHDAEAQTAQARAQVQQAELNLSYTQIRSPLSGLAGLALVRPGNLVGQDAPTLLTTVSQVDPVRVTFPLSEADYVRFRSQLKRISGRDLGWARRQFERLARGEVAEGEDPGAELALSDGKVYPARGVVVAANRQVDAATGTIQLEALFPNPDGVLRPGQFARVRLRRTSEGRGAIVVPEKALVQVQGTYSLAVVGEGGKVQLRRVEVGPSADGLRIVSSGLRAGERVVVEGVQKASDGAVVDPQPAPELSPGARAAR